MTDYPLADADAARPRRLTDRLRRRQQEISDRVHSPGDTYATAHGWTTTTATGRLGMGARIYHDQRFGTRTQAPPAGAAKETAQMHDEDRVEHPGRGGHAAGQPPGMPGTTRGLPVHIAQAIGEWARTQDPARLAGWADGPHRFPITAQAPDCREATGNGPDQSAPEAGA